MSGRQILKELPQVNVSQRTILRRLREEGLPARRPAKKPLLSKKNVKARIQFAKKYCSWSADDWGKFFLVMRQKLISSKVMGPLMYIVRNTQD